jgi:predicted O-methyltransferase YrrM
VSASPERWAEVDRYIDESLVGSDPVLEAALDAATAAGIPPYQLTPSQGKLLHLLARVQRARTILELGTLGGYSTIWLARALPAGGRLVTLELDAGYAELARANLERAGVGDRVDVRVGPALDSLARLAADGADPFDLVFIDADKSSNDEYLEWALRLSRPGTLIVADNVIREGAVADPDSRDEHVQGVRRMNDLIAAEPRLTATAIQTVGAKGYDGFAIALVEPGR